MKVTVSSEVQDGLLGLVYSQHDVTVWSVQTVYSVWAPCIIARLLSNSNFSIIQQITVQSAVPVSIFLISYKSYVLTAVNIYILGFYVMTPCSLVSQSDVSQ